MKVSKQDFFTVPNILTYFRFLLIPTVCVFYFLGKYLFAAGFTALFWFIDIIDGRIARRFNQVTDLGKMLDPIVDKLFQFCVIVIASTIHKTVQLLVILQLIKEITLIIIAGYGMAKYNIHESSRWYGKLNTGILNVTIIVFVLFGRVLEPWCEHLIVAVNCFSLIASFVLYMIYYLNLIRQQINTGAQ